MDLDEFGDIVLSTNPHEASDIMYKMNNYVSAALEYCSMPRNVKQLLRAYLVYSKDYIMVIRSFIQDDLQAQEAEQAQKGSAKKNNKK